MGAVLPFSIFSLTVANDPQPLSDVDVLICIPIVVPVAEKMGSGRDPRSGEPAKKRSKARGDSAQMPASGVMAFPSA